MKRNNLHKNNGGFKVPQGYFESFKNELSERIAFDDKEDTLLDSKTDSGFKVPERYFEDFENNVLRRVDQQKIKVVSLFTKRNLLYVSGIAAMIAIILSISINKKSNLNFEDIEIADIHAYFNEGNIDVSNDEIANLLAKDVSYTEAFENEILDDQDLIDYISDEDLEDEIMFVE